MPIRFDGDRATALTGEFRTLRIAGSAAHRHAVDRIEAELRHAGYHVERTVRSIALDPAATLTPLEIWPPAFLAVGAGAALELLWIRAGIVTSPLGLAVAFTALALVALVLRRIAHGTWRRPVVPVIDLVAWDQDGADSRFPETWIATHSDTRPPARSWGLHRWLIRLDTVWLAALWIPALALGGWSWLERAGPTLLVSLGLLSALRALDPWTHELAPYAADNRTGLALALACVQGAPAHSAFRQRTGFLVLGGPLDPAHAPAWLPRLRSATPRRPPQAIALESPGTGLALDLAGPPGLMTPVRQVAIDLWLPLSPRPFRRQPLDHEALAALGITAVTLRGDPDSTHIDPRLVAAAAQWAIELTLRATRPD